MSKKKKVIGLVCIIVALTAIIGGHTFSKYVTEVKGEGIADIAKWSFNVNGDTSTIQTINLVSTYDESTLVNGKIAPGTEGSFDIIIDATESEVGIDYKVEFEKENNKPTNLVFYYKDEKYTSLAELQKELKGTINADEETKTITLKIKWEWKYETGEDKEDINDNDEIDTNEGKTLQNYKFNVNVIGTQVQPLL